MSRQTKLKIPSPYFNLPSFFRFDVSFSVSAHIFDTPGGETCSQWPTTFGLALANALGISSPSAIPAEQTAANLSTLLSFECRLSQGSLAPTLVSGQDKDSSCHDKDTFQAVNISIIRVNRFLNFSITYHSCLFWRCD